MIQDLAEKYSNPDPRIEWARKYNDKLMLHVHGVGLDQALEQINNYENDYQKIARDKFAISNKFITDRLLRPTDNVFAAKGGYKKYLFLADQEKHEEQFVQSLMDVYSGYNLSQYIHRIWFDKYIVDPNGLIFMEVSEDANEIYPTYKSIHSIRNYSQDGIKVEWVIFEPDVVIFDEERGVKNEPKEELFWAVDKYGYYRCVKDKEGIRVKFINTHNFKEVPARLCSDIEDHVSGWKKSPFDAQIEMLDKFMTDNSVLNIVEFFHSYPQQWMYIDECPRCNGTGEIHGGVPNRDGSVDNTCPSCGGSGKSDRKDVTDIIKLKPPGEGEQRVDPPGGYLSLPPESWKLMTSSVDRTWNIIIFSHWGTSLEYGGTDGNQYASATGRWIDTQPVNNKLNRYTESVQLIHNSLADIYGKFYFPETFDRSEVIYGRRYLIETPDQLKKSYTEVSNLTDNMVLLDVIFDQYLESEFRDNDQMYVLYKKLLALDPFPHMTVDQVILLNNPNKLNQKIYVNEFKNSVDMKHIIDTPLKELKAEYKAFINEKEKDG
jgi:hypothetical protein